MPRRSRRQDAGSLLITAMVVLVGMATLANVGISRSMTDIRSTDQVVDSYQAFYLAEAGAEVAIAEYRTGGVDGSVGSFALAADANPAAYVTDTGWYDPDGGVALAGCTSGGGICARDLALVTGQIAVAVSDIGATQPIITITGTAGAISEQIEIVVQAQTAAGGAGYVVAAKGTIEMDGDTTRYDSYDSTLGPYGGANVFENVIIHTNSNAPNAIKIGKDIEILGTVTVGDGPNPASVVVDQGEGVYISGGAPTIDPAPVSFPPIEIPPGSPCSDPRCGGVCTPLETDQNKTFSADPTKGMAFCHTSVKLTGTNQITFNHDGQITLDATGFDAGGSGSLRTNGNLTLVSPRLQIANTGNELTVGGAGKFSAYVTDEVKTDSGSLQNLSQDPKNLRINYSGTTDVKFRRTGDFYGAIYAPNASLFINGHGDIYGAVAAKDVDADGYGEFHFDESLGLITTQGGGGAAGPSGDILSWRQP